MGFVAGPADRKQTWAMISDFLEADLTDLSWLISTRELSSAEVVTGALERLRRIEPRLNAFITVLDEQAHAAAKTADDEIAHGRHRGPLHGIPITVKDMFATSGVRTTGASKILLDWIPNFDAHIVERLDAAGAILIGKTNLDEFGHGAQSLEYRAHRRRLPRRISRCRRRAHRPALLRHRDRIIGAPPGVLLRHRRIQADLRHY